jgi:glycosyltransferase involved in cell wall biosynthesis
MNKRTPAISVIIPTHNRCNALKRALDALSIQTYRPEQFEVVIVADGCTDDTLEMLGSYSAPFRLHLLEQSNQGPAGARNHGVDCASGRLLIFLDDDVESSQSLVEAHLSAHRQYPDHVIIGYYPTVVYDHSNFFQTEIRSWWEAIFSPMRQPGHRYTYRNLLSGNLSMDAELFASMGGFDQNLVVHEDWEFGVRLIKAGVPFIHASDAIGYHHETSNLERLLQRKYQEGRADVLIGKRHPELRADSPLADRVSKPWSWQRILRTVAFGLPRVGNAFVSCSRFMLDLLEIARLRRSWRSLLGALFYYYYWLGIKEELGKQRILTNFLQVGLAYNRLDEEMKIDLRDGLEAAEQRLDEKRPAGACIRYGRYELGRIPAQPGAEPLRGVHLRPILASQLAKPLFKAMALEGAFGEFPDVILAIVACGLESQEPIDACLL